MEKEAKIFIAGHEGMIGLAILHCLKESGFNNLLTRDSTELDLTEQSHTLDFFMTERPGYVFLTSIKVGGILANSRYPADFIYTNLSSEMNVIHSAWKSGVKKLLFLASSCIYPKNCPQPMKEEYLLDGKLEPTSEPYAIAKIAGIRMCQSYNRQYGTEYVSAVPADVYGPGDDFNPETGHVLPALISKMHRAKINNESEVVVWGTGSPRREALHVEDLADASIMLMDEYSDTEIINIGSGEDVSIKEMAVAIKEVVGFEGKVVFDESKPDGMPRKLLDARKITKLGWSPKIRLADGVRQTYQWFKNQPEKI
ncbi:GDP-L-fucose synthase family protein [Chloroflexota bacterium]